jgi:hypothetical protein
MMGYFDDELRHAWLEEARREAAEHNPLRGYCKRVYFERRSCKRRTGPRKGQVRRRSTHEVELLMFLPSGRCVAVKDLRTPGLDALGRGSAQRARDPAAHDARPVVFGLFQTVMRSRMKAKEYLNLTAETRKEQKAYYATRSQYPLEAKQHLAKAKMLERRMDAVIAEGTLEPDEVITTTASAEEQRQLRLHLEDKRDAGERETED